MFDKLVESTKQKNGRHAGRFFAITTMVYALALMIIGVATIVTFSPVLAEEYSMILHLVPPPIPLDRQLEVKQQQKQVLKAEPQPRFVAPRKTVDIPPVTDVTHSTRPIPTVETGIGSGPYPGGDKEGIPGSGLTDSIEPPPPAPKPPKPVPPSPPTPERQQTQKVSEGVLRGIAITKVKPAYPQIARAARASGVVQILVTISEEGFVTEAVVLSGHQLLQRTALEAARKWVFSPTKLSGVPVKVQGVLTFNFTLE